MKKGKNRIRRGRGRGKGKGKGEGEGFFVWIVRGGVVISLDCGLWGGD